MSRKLSVPIISCILTLVILVLALISCTASRAPANSGYSVPRNTTGAETSASSQAGPEASWETKWDSLLKSAQKEAKIMIYSSLSPEPQVAWRSSFKKRFNIEVEFLVGRGGEIAEKLLSEKRAGLKLADIYLGGNTTTFTQLKPAGLLGSLAPSLVIPEVKEARFWFGGKFPYSDTEGTSMPFAAYAVIPIAVNSNLVKANEINSYKDLLQPKWNGKIILSDPTIAGGPAKWFGVMIQPGKLGLDYMRALASQKPVITRDRRLELDWVSHGKYPVIMMPKSDVASEFIRLGAPIGLLTPVEGSHWTGGSANISIMKDPAHPDAAVVFLNWLLSREGQEIFVKASGLPSARIDVPAQGVDPLMLLKPGIDYFDSNTEEFVLHQPEQMKLAVEIFGPLLK